MNFFQHLSCATPVFALMKAFEERIWKDQKDSGHWWFSGYGLLPEDWKVALSRSLGRFTSFSLFTSAIELFPIEGSVGPLRTLESSSARTSSRFSRKLAGVLAYCLCSACSGLGLQTFKRLKIIWKWQRDHSQHSIVSPWKPRSDVVRCQTRPGDWQRYFAAVGHLEAFQSLGRFYETKATGDIFWPPSCRIFQMLPDINFWNQNRRHSQTVLPHTKMDALSSMLHLT